MQAREAITVALSIVVATAVGTFCFIVCLLSRADPWVPGPITQPYWPAVFIAWALGMVVMAPIAVIVGVPSYAVLRQFRIFNWWSVGLVGAALGLFAKLVFRVVPASSSACFGVFTALLAWALIAGANYSFQRTLIRYAASRR